MSIQRVKGNVVFVCDECRHDLNTEMDNFMQAASFSKTNGWIHKKTFTGWQHYCADCKR